MKNAEKKIGKHRNLNFINNWKSVLGDVDIIIIGTKWNEYKKLNLVHYKKQISGKVLLDARRLFKPSDFSESIYLTIGRNINV